MSTADRLPKKVLHVFNGASGGAALSTLALIESFRDRGIEACAVCHDMGSTQEREMLRDGLRGQVVFTPLYWWNRKIRARAWKRPILELLQLLQTGWKRRSVAEVAAFAQQNAVDMIHTNTILTPEGGLAARRLGLPHVWHLRELVGKNNAFRLTHDGAALGRYLAGHCSKLIANSYITAAQVQNNLPAGLLEIVPNGIDLAAFEPKVEPAVAGKVVVAMVGSLHSHTKRHALFIDAAALVDRSLPVEFRVYGHDPAQGGEVHGSAYALDLRRRVDGHGLADRFRWAGFIADPAKIMAEIDVLVHPSEMESFGRVAVEAMASGLPVVAVRGGGVGEIVQHAVTGLLATPNDPADLAHHIERVASDEGLRRIMGIAGRKRAELDYSLTACADRVLQVYSEAMQRPLSRQLNED